MARLLPTPLSIVLARLLPYAAASASSATVAKNAIVRAQSQPNLADRQSIHGTAAQAL
jgi:hypothetical protein